jgi:hypothetical protein
LRDAFHVTEGSYERDNCCSGEEGNRSIDENEMGEPKEEEESSHTQKSLLLMKMEYGNQREREVVTYGRR